MADSITRRHVHSRDTYIALLEFHVEDIHFVSTHNRSMDIRVMWDDDQEIWHSPPYRPTGSQEMHNVFSKTPYFKMLVRQSESRYVLNWEILEHHKLKFVVVGRAEVSLESLCSNAGTKNLSVPLYKLTDAYRHRSSKSAMDDSSLKTHNPTPNGIRFATMYLTVYTKTQEQVYRWFWNSFTHHIIQSLQSNYDNQASTPPKRASPVASTFVDVPSKKHLPVEYSAGSPSSSPELPDISGTHSPLSGSPLGSSPNILPGSSPEYGHIDEFDRRLLDNLTLADDNDQVLEDAAANDDSEAAKLVAALPPISLTQSGNFPPSNFNSNHLKEMILLLGIETNDEDFERMCKFLKIKKPSLSTIAFHNHSPPDGHSGGAEDHEQDSIAVDEFLVHLLNPPQPPSFHPSNPSSSMTEVSETETDNNIITSTFLGRHLNHDEYVWETALVNDSKRITHLVVGQRLRPSAQLIQTSNAIYDSTGTSPSSSNSVSFGPASSSTSTGLSPGSHGHSNLSTSPIHSSISASHPPTSSTLRSSLSSAYGFLSRQSGSSNVKERRKDLIFVQDRETGKVVEEKMPKYLRRMLRGMYSNRTGRGLVGGSLSKSLLKRLTFNQAKKYTAPSSVAEIPAFIQFHNIDVTEILDPIESFSNFNEFFIRKLKPNARPLAGVGDPAWAISPADCRLHVYETLSDAQRLWIKGKTFSLRTLLDDPQLETEFAGCSLVIARLAPQDYHRFHYPVSGFSGKYITQGDAYYTVNPIAIRENVDVYSLNKRTSVIVESPDFGKVMIICVGATMVGSVVLTSGEDVDVNKGDELGYFAFGGSTLLVLFQHGRIKFDDDLLFNSAKQQETLVKMGTSLGRATRPANMPTSSA